MPDATYDAVIIGGGTKALSVAMYLARYGGMSVGVFESRHEAGGGWAGEENAAPGFVSNTHATMIFPWLHYTSVQRDFPEFEEYGCKLDQHVCTNAAIFRDNQQCLTIYSTKHDPTQERTAREIARFSEKDAELWLKIWDLRELIGREIVGRYNIPTATAGTALAEIRRSMAIALAEKGIQLDPVQNTYSILRAAKELWESKEIQCLIVRQALSGGSDVTLPGGGGLRVVLLPMLMPYMCFHVGGTHQVAHSCHKILLRDGGKVWTHCEVEKVIIENGSAKGIRLTDGTEIGAKKVVISTLSPQQLCFDMIGREHLSPQIIRRIELLESDHTTIAWYNWAIHEAPKYIAAESNPDISDANWLGLHQTNDPDTFARETYWRRLGKMAPLEDLNPVVWCHSLIDPRYAAEGKHLASHENFMPPATALNEKEWLVLKKQHAEDMISLWQTFAPNMTWDNVIGYAPDTPYDCLRMKNMAPNGCWSIIDPVPHQVESFRPIPELSSYRTPIKNLYATGSAFGVGAGASVNGGYCCYKMIAEDLGLSGPWPESGEEDLDSLVQQALNTEKKWQEQAKREKAEKE